MRGVNLPEDAFRYSLLQHFAHAPVNRLKICLYQSIYVFRMSFARTHHFPLHQFGIDLVRSDEIEIRSHVGQDLFARSQGAIEHLENIYFHGGKGLIQYRSVQRFLVLKVVIKQGLVDPRLARDRVRTSPRNTVIGKLFRRSLQNGGAALLRLPPRTHAGSLGPTMTEGGHC